MEQRLYQLIYNKITQHIEFAGKTHKETLVLKAPNGADRAHQALAQDITNVVIDYIEDTTLKEIKEFIKNRITQ